MCCIANKSVAVTSTLLGSVAVTLTILLVAAAPQTPASAKPSPLDRMKALAGDWKADTNADGTPDMDVNYKVISNGNTVVETIFEDQPHEMITVFTMDKGDLVLTHYCAIGNQPFCRAKSITPEAIEFEFVRGGNMSSRDEDHMDSVTYTWLSPDKVNSTWFGYEEGKVVPHITFAMTRAPAPAPAVTAKPAAPAPSTAR